jgi:preprotein translocase subunit YajC
MIAMDFLIPTALAQGAPAGAPQGSMLSPLIMMVLFFVVFWFIAIRPQMKRAKEHRALLAGLAKGDEVIAAGGLMGRVADLAESIVTLEIADGVHVKVQKQAVVTVLPKGTLKSA